MTRSTGTTSGTLTALGHCSGNSIGFFVRLCSPLLKPFETLAFQARDRLLREQVPPFDRHVSWDPMCNSGIVESLRITDSGNASSLLPSAEPTSHPTESRQHDGHVAQPSSIGLLDVNKSSNNDTAASFCKEDDRTECRFTFTFPSHKEAPPPLPPDQRKILPLPRRRKASSSSPRIPSPSFGVKAPPPPLPPDQRKIIPLPRRRKGSSSPKIPSPPISPGFKAPPIPPSYPPPPPRRKTLNKKTKKNKKKSKRTSTTTRRPSKNSLDRVELVATDSDDWVCLFCQYELFKRDWKQQYSKKHPSSTA